MRTFLVFGEPHHNEERSGSRNIVDVPDGEDVEYACLCEAWRDSELGSEFEPPSLTDLDCARQNGETGVILRPLGDTPYDQENSGGASAVIWYHPDADYLNYGFGPSDDGTVDGSSKSENTWISFVPYEPNERRAAELQSLSKAELIDKLLRAECLAGRIV